MRDAVDLQGKHINYQQKEYIIEDFCLLPKAGQVYVRLQDMVNKMYLNVPLSLLMITLQQQIKL